ncbi:MAG: hypothetical protein DBX91_14790 [Subdoligranulum variabile]|nr:MAG: hypothetical protein DBX91_14790 [Subdoligranulum variabile]
MNLGGAASGTDTGAAGVAGAAGAAGVAGAVSVPDSTSTPPPHCTGTAGASRHSNRGLIASMVSGEN